MTTTSIHTAPKGRDALHLARPRVLSFSLQRWQEVLIVAWFLALPWLHFWRLWFGLPQERGYVAWNFFEERWPRFQSAVSALFSQGWAQWDPWLGGGWPLAAEPSLGLYSPSHWPYLLYFAIFRTHEFLVFQSLLMWQIALAGWGMYLYLRIIRVDPRAAWFGGTLFSVAGLTPLFYGTHLFAAVLWLPWVMWSLERFLEIATLKRATWLALFLGFGCLGGSPTGFLLLAVFAGFYALFRFLWDGIERPRKTLLGLGYVVVLVGLWGASWGLPYLELARELPPHHVSSHEFPLFRLWGFFSPQYGNHLYHGIFFVPLFLAAWASETSRRVLWACSTLVFWGLLFAAWPQMRAFDPMPSFLFTQPYLTSRPDRYLALISPACCVLAALGFQALLRPDPKGWQRFYLVALSVLWGVAGVVLLSASLWSLSHGRFSQGQETQVFQQWVLCGGMLYCVWRVRRRFVWGWSLCFVLLVWLDIAPHTRQSGHRSFSEYLDRQGEMLVRIPPPAQQHQRVFNAHDEAPKLASALFGLRALEGVDIPRQTFRDKAVMEEIKKHPSILRLYGVSHVITSRPGNSLYHLRFFSHPSSLQQAYLPTETDAKAALHESRRPIAARVQWLPRWRVVARWQDAVKQLAALDPTCDIVVEASPHTPPPPRLIAQKVIEPLSFKAKRIGPPLPKTSIERPKRHAPETKVRSLMPRIIAVRLSASRPVSLSTIQKRAVRLHLPTSQPVSSTTAQNSATTRPLVPSARREGASSFGGRVVFRFLPPPCPTKPLAAKILQADGQHLLALIDAPRDGILLINERFWPGWTASLDFKPVPLLRANVLMQAVAIPKGRHTLHLAYRSRSVFVGLALWGLAWLIALASLAMTVLWAEPVQPKENP